MNPHNPFGSADFKSAASANFAIPAEGVDRFSIARRIAGYRSILSSGIPTTFVTYGFHFLRAINFSNS